MSLSFGALAGLMGIGSAGSLFSTAIGAGLSSRQAKRQYNYQRQLNQQAYDLTQQGYREMYGNLRTGLENAGYNPILATSMGTGGNFTSGSAASANSVQTPNVADILNGASNAYRAFELDKKRTNAEVENLDANTKNVNAKTVTEGYNQQLIQSQYLLNQINTELAKKDLSWKDRMYLMQEKTGYLNAAAAHLGAEAQQLNANTAVQHFKLEKEMQNIINFKTKVENDIYDRSKGSARAKIYRGVRAASGALFGR